MSDINFPRPGADFADLTTEKMCDEVAGAFFEAECLAQTCCPEDCPLVDKHRGPQEILFFSPWLLRLRIISGKDICALCAEECCEHFHTLGPKERRLRDFKARCLLFIFQSRGFRLMRKFWNAARLDPKNDDLAP